jgi:hypothetical protein
MQCVVMLWPVAAMFMLTIGVWTWMYVLRLSHIRRAGINPQRLATRDAKAAAGFPEAEINASNHLSNLFEVPVIFYALMLAIMFTGQQDSVYLGLAWTFVAFRIVQALIHLGPNHVISRFAVYALGCIVLWVMVLRFVVLLATGDIVLG